jgi:hypothetical protein
MNVKQAARATPKWARHSLRAVRSLSPLAAFGLTAAVVLGGAGVASASNGGNFILGNTNQETSTSYLNNSTGTPLKLNAPNNVAPLKVSNSTLVSGLNAQYVNGLSSSKLVAGGDGYTVPSTDAPINSSEEEVASTGSLSAGTYYVNATALLDIASADTDGFCFITKGSSVSPINWGGGDQTGFMQAAETAAVQVNAGDTLQEWCESGGTGGSFAYNAAITAIRVLSSSGTTPAVAGRSKAAAPGR